MLKQFVSLYVGVLAFFLAVKSVPATDVRQILIAKGAALVQTNSNPPGLAATPFEFQCQVELWAPGNASSMSVRAPARTTNQPLENLESYFALQLGFATKAKLDAACPAGGNYSLSVQGVHDGLQTPLVFMGGDAYPTDPRILNWADLQNVHAESNVVISWMPYVGGTAQDFIQVRIYNDLGDFFSTPDYGQPGALNGTSTSISVPADALFPGEAYTLEILFANILTSGPSTYPAAVAVTGYYKRTTTTLLTYNEFGALEFTARNFNVYEYEGAGEVTVTRRGGIEGEVRAAYTTANGSAIGGYAQGPGVDYGISSGILVFAPGERTKTIPVPIYDDRTGEPTKVVQLFLFGFEGGASPGLVTDATLTILDDEAPVGPNVGFYLVAKGQNYTQASTNTPTLASENAPYRFVAAVEAAFSNGVYNGAVTTPANITRQLAAATDGLQFNFDEAFNLKSAMDAAYPSGNYRFTITSFNQGLKTPVLNLPVEAYPSTPRFANWIEAQEIEPSAEFILSWDPMVGGTTNDLINISIRTSDGTDLISSPWLFEPGYLNGLATNWTIPSNFLQAGQTYTARLLFIKRAALNLTAYAGVPGLSAFYKETAASIAAAATPTIQGRLVFASRMYSLAENGVEATITVNRVGGSLGQVTVDYTTYNGSALAPSDYTATSGTLTFEEGETTKSFNVHVNDNFFLNGNRTLFLGLSNPTGGAVIPNYPYAALTIVDNESGSAGTLQFANTNIVVLENSGKATVVLTRTGGTAGTITVGLFVGTGTASVGLDFIDPTATVTFNPGETTKTIVVPIINDSLDEPNETIQLYLSNTTGGASLGANRATKITITDEDVGGIVQFAARAISVNETSSVVNLKVTRVGGGASGVSVDYTAFDGTAANELDYALTTGTLTFGSNELSKIIAVPLLNDSLAEGNETFSVVLSHPQGGAVLGAISNIVVTIVDDESSIQFSSPSYTNSEGLLTANITVQRLGPIATPATIDYFTANGTAGNLDYLPKSGRLTFNPGIASQIISLVISNDTIVEGQESFQVVLTNVVGALFGLRTNATVYINDNDLGGTIQFSATNYTVAENLANASVTITRIGGVASGVTVDFATFDDTALDGRDYLNSSQTITFKANEVTKTVLIPIRNNSLDQTNKSLKLFLSNAQGGAVLDKNTRAILTITDEDVGGTVQFNAASYLVSETNGFITATILRIGGLASEVAVDFSTEDISATAGVNYTATNGTLVFGSNQTSLVLKIPVLHDNIDTTNKTFRLLLSNPRGGGTLGPVHAVIITIQDNDLDIRGNYSGSGSFSQAKCLDVANVFSSPVTVQISILEQAGFEFTGTLSMLPTPPGSSPIVLTLSGSVNGAGILSGHYSSPDLTRTGTLSGRVVGKAIQISFNGPVSFDTSCLDTGLVSASRP